MLREVLYHEEAMSRAAWETPPIYPGDNAGSYADMMLDPTVTYAVGLIQDAVMAGGWHIEPADRQDRRSLAMADDIRRNLEDLDTESALQDALDAIWRGFSAQEIAWRFDGRRVTGDGGRSDQSSVISYQYSVIGLLTPR